MSKTELVEFIAAKAGVSKAEAGRALDATFEVIAEALEKGDKVPLVGFGTFGTSKRGARTARNPRTGETIKIPARKAVVFKAGTALKNRVN